jgi:hypothetical protein
MKIAMLDILPLAQLATPHAIRSLERYMARAVWVSENGHLLEPFLELRSIANFISVVFEQGHESLECILARHFCGPVGTILWRPPLHRIVQCPSNTIVTVIRVASYFELPYNKVGKLPKYIEWKRHCFR